MRNLITIAVIAMLFITAIFYVSFSFKPKTTTDHSEFISGPFASPQEITHTCLGCHQEQADDIMKSVHWLWQGEEFEHPTKGKIKYGKKNAINNSGISIATNEELCASCHIGYGWQNNNFDFTAQENIDCVICHDNTGTYFKGTAGKPLPNIDLVKVAQSVGKPTIKNCGNCHFEGAKENPFRHGNIEPTLISATRGNDVHMGGLKYDCIDCHKTEKHIISGAGHTSLISDANRVKCADCHNTQPKPIHKNAMLNRHIDAISCETCHIPAYGKEFATKTFWDWSTAGSDMQDKISENITFTKNNGTIHWQKNVTPVFAWYSGQIEYYMLGDKISGNQPELNRIIGSPADANSKIAPFRIMRSNQVYDKANNYLAVTKFIGDDGYWKTYDWKSAIELGMKEVNLEFSGEYGFIETIMYYPLNHNVVPKEQALKCNECHNKGKLLDWKALGYSDDPIKKGGRIKQGMIKK